MKLLEFENIEELETSLLAVIEKQLKIALKTNDDVLVLLSGGSTPINLYKRFNSISDIDWGKVSFGLVDERWLKNDNEQSNFNNIFQALGAEITDNAVFLPMVYNTDDEAKNLLLSKTANSTFLNQKTIVFLGMGSDGNTGSLFPGTEQTETALSSIEPDIVLNVAPSAPLKRITHNLKSLLNTKKLILYINGGEKKEVFKNARVDLLPISYFMNSQSSDLEVFWSP